MLVVFGYWLYVFLLTSVYGVFAKKLLTIKEIHPALTLLLGGFILTGIASIWVFFGGLSARFDGFIVICFFIVGFFLRKDVKIFFKELSGLIKSLPTFLKIVLGIICILAAAKSSGAPFILDNESYYIQTIKWLDTYGLVNGLANLHPFFAQTSGWHIFQSAINLNSLIPNLNDVNGFFLIAANLYAVDHLANYYKTKSGHLLVIGSFVFFNLFLFQFIDAPSPDLPIYICGFFIFSEFLKHSKNTSEYKETFLLLFCIATFATYIKVSALLLFIFPLFLLVKKVKLNLKHAAIVVAIGTLTLILFIAKNYIISGYAFYPIDLFASEGPVWKLPASLHHFITYQTELYGYFMNAEQFESSSVFQRLWHWFNIPGLHGWFNKLMSLVLVLFPFLIWRLKHKTPFYLLYAAAVLQMLLLWSTSPQYRFFFGILMLLLMASIPLLLKKKSIINPLLALSVFVIAIPLFFPLSLTSITNNQFQKNLRPFSIENVVTPHPNTRYTTAKFAKISEGNLIYNTPVKIDFFWATGDGALPCVQASQVEYLKSNFEVFPQLIGSSISEGFYSLKVLNE